MWPSVNRWINLFLIYIYFFSYFGRYYVNYKWQDHVIWCSIWDSQADKSDDDCLRQGLEVGLAGGSRQVQVLPAVGNSVDNSIIF